MTPMPVIIEVALNGLTSKKQNPNVPLSPDELAEDAARCIEAGASIVHTHNPEFGVDAERAADLYQAAWQPALELHPDAIFYPTMGFGSGEEKIRHQAILAKRGVLRVGLADPGSVNLGGVDDEGLPIPHEFVYVNSPKEVRQQFDLCQKFGLGPSVSIFEPGFLRTALAYARAERLPRGALIKIYLGGEYGYMGSGQQGLGFGLPPTFKSVDVYLELMRGFELPWSIAVLGGDLMESDLPRYVLERGGHLRVGLEDYAGTRQPRNVELVDEAVRLISACGRPVATPAEAAKLLDLPR